MVCFCQSQLLLTYNNYSKHDTFHRMSIWQELEENIYEYWRIFILSLPKITISLIVLCAFILAAFAVGRIFRQAMTGKATDSIIVTFVVRITKTILIILGVILAFHAMGFKGIAGGILAGAGIGAIVIGFAFKEIGENFLAGIILVFDRPFNIGDIVKINNNMGNVVNLKFRTTHIKSFDGKDVYVPNGAVIRNDVINFTRDGFLRHEFTIGIDYQENIAHATQLIVNTINGHVKVVRHELTHALVDGFSTNSVDLKIFFWVNTYDYLIDSLAIKSEVMRDVKNAVLAHGFKLPANILELKAYNSNSLPILLHNESNDNKNK